MKNLKYIIIAAIALLFAMTSCSDDGKEIVRVLEVEKPSFSLKKEGQVKKISVTVDKGAIFTATWSGDSWGRVSAVNTTEGFIEITTSTNTTEASRDATIIVALKDGLRNRVISITQDGENPVIDVIPDEFECDFMANEVIIEVSSDVDWEVSSEVDWLSADAYKKKGVIVVAIEENEMTNARSTSITITAGTSSKEVLVVQEAALSFILPYLNTQDATFESIEEFEHARYSQVIKKTVMMDYHRAFTRSKLMPLIEYELTMGPRITFISITLNEKHMPGFFSNGETRGKGYDLMLASGYEYLFSAGQSDYFWVEMGAGSTHFYIAELYGKKGYVTFQATAKENKPTMPDAPTFDVFPHMPDAIAMGSNKDVVKTWEAANGGILFHEDDKLMVYEVVTGDPLQHNRYYNYAQVDTDLATVTYIFKDTENTKLFVYVVGGATLNSKFRAMLASEGFVEDGKDGPYQLFKHVERDLLIKPYIVTIGAGTTKYGAIAFRRKSTSGASPQFKAPDNYKAADIDIVR